MGAPPFSGGPPGSSLTDVVVTFQNAVEAANQISRSLAATVPSLTGTSGQMSADTVIFPGAGRVTGYSIVVAGATGALYDTTSVAGATGTNLVFVVPSVTGYQSVNMVFANGLVYKPGASQKAVIFYTRV